MPNVRLLTGWVLVLFTITLGCGGGSKGPLTAVVSGKVTLDGEPLADGSINFIPADGKGTPSGAKIAKGYYSASVPLGDKRVEIQASKVIGQKVAYEGDPNSPKYDIKQELIPSRYNAESKLKATVTKSGNKADFSLESPNDTSTASPAAN